MPFLWQYKDAIYRRKEDMEAAMQEDRPRTDEWRPGWVVRLSDWWRAVLQEEEVRRENQRRFREDP
jgi:hypothetical protein